MSANYALNADDGRPLAELVNEFIVAKARTGRSDRYLRALRNSLGKFAHGRARRPVASLTVREVESWIDRPEWAARTQAGYLADVRVFLNYCLRRGYVARNVAACVEAPVCVDLRPPGIHTPAEVAAVLATARRADLDVLRQLAIRYFGGLRSSETMRLREENLRISEGLIEVPAAKSKTRRRRLVTIQPALAAWLAEGGVLRGMREARIRDVAKRSGVRWSQNVTRHSFVSYHLAGFRNAGETAMEAGHSEAMLYQHYRALVTPAAAAEFWALRPTS